MAVDRRGNLYVAEFVTGRVFRFSPDGESTLLAEGLDGPTGLCLDRDGNLLVAENGAGRVVRISPDGGKRLVAGK